jgi:hypothetical protein
MNASKRFPIRALVGSLALSGVCVTASAATLFEDAFNTTTTAALNQTVFTNFNVTGGTVDVIGNGFNDLLPGNGLYVDLDGSSNQAGLFSTKNSFSLVPGTTYTLSFSLAGSQRGDTNLVTVTLGSAFNQTFTRLSGDPFTTVSANISVLAPVTAPLTFQNAGGDNTGALLDNVSLTSNAVAAIPEPENYAMMLAGLGVMAFLLRRKKQSSA